jgi:hypothetical protein
VPIECQIRADLLQLAVFVEQRPNSHSSEAEPGDVFLPAVERVFADAEPATDLENFLTA